ncbi:hypothetical protein E4U54_001874 [Claviceps lovelessii]|nr:hypothetical protein E4U54_001874 [Claviceps lovelessii]
MPPRKRTSPGVADSDGGPVPKRRSSRQAALATTKKETPAVEQIHKATAKPRAEPVAKSANSPSDEPSKAVKVTVASHGGGISDGVDVDAIPVINPEAPRHEGEWYWLMKAEPESRLENGVDVKFSIDDLKAKTKPEGWDGGIPFYISHSVDTTSDDGRTVN